MARWGLTGLRWGTGRTWGVYEMVEGVVGVCESPLTGTPFSVEGGQAVTATTETATTPTLTTDTATTPTYTTEPVCP